MELIMKKGLLVKKRLDIPSRLNISSVPTLLLLTALLGTTSHISFSAQPPRMVPIESANRVFSEKFNLGEEQQKTLASKLAEIADKSGKVNIDTAREVARVIRDTPAAPTQAGPAPAAPAPLNQAPTPANKEEMEEKEESELPAKAGIKYKTDLETEIEIRRALIAINKRKGGKKLDPQSDVIKQMGKQIASFEPIIVRPWNIQFAPGEISKVLKGTKPAHIIKASANGRYLATLSGYAPSTPEKSLQALIAIWDMQLMRKVKVLSVDVKSKSAPAFALSPTGDRLVFFPGDYKTGVVINVKNNATVSTISIAEVAPIVHDLKANFPSSGYVIVEVLRVKRASDGTHQYHNKLTYNANTGALLDVKIVAESERPSKVRFSPDKTKSVTEDSLGLFSVRDLKKNSLIFELHDKNKRHYYLNNLVFDSESKQLAALLSGFTEYNVEIWDTEIGKKVGDISLKGGPSPDMIFSPDGHYLAISDPNISQKGREGADITVWNLAEVKRRYARSQEQAEEQESKAEEENKEVAAVAPATPTSAAPAMPPAPIPTPVSTSPAPQAPGVSRKLTVEQAMQEFPGGRLPTKEQRTRWERELEQMAADSTDNKIDYENVWELFESIKNWGNF